MKMATTFMLLASTALAGAAMAQSSSARQGGQPDASSSATGQQSSAGANDSNDTGVSSEATSDRSRPSAAGTSDQQSSTVRSQGERQASQRGASPSPSGNLERHIAVCLTLGNEEEVALAEFAQGRAQNPQVKEFAQMMIEEHQKAISQLQQVAPEIAALDLELTSQANENVAPGGAVSDPARAGEARSASSPSTSQAAGNQRTLASGATAGGEDQQMVQLAREIKQECLNLTQAELGRHEGVKFDKAYIGQQLVAHIKMLAELRAVKRHASGQLQPIVQQGVQMTEHHLAEARQIMEQLEADGGQEAAARPEAASARRR